MEISFCKQAPVRPSALEVRSWLQWAGSKLLTLPVGRIGPEGAKSSWLFQTVDDFAGAGYTATRLKRESLTPTQINTMDEILRLTHLINDETTRRIVNARSLVRNLSGTNVYSYKKLSRLLALDPNTVKARYGRGVMEIVNKVPTSKVHRFRDFFAS